MKSSLFESLINYKNKNFAQFHMPGHKDRFLPESLCKVDVTELFETDNLFEAKSIIKEAEEAATKLFGTKETLFCAGGNTLCIQTMLRLCAPEGGKIICSRIVHKSVIDAMSLLNIEPIWVLPAEKEKSIGLPGVNSLKNIENALKSNLEARGVFITSPDYYGQLSDIAEISKICKEFNVPFLVDNAHGTHLRFLNPNLHPVTLGADITADSAHKTLPVLTGGAFLQINSNKFTKKAKEAMSIFGSTSPSYPIMASLDLARDWLEKYGKFEFEKLNQRIQRIKKMAKEKGFIIPEVACDPVRISMSAVNLGYSGKLLWEYLRKNKIQPEFFDKNFVILIPSPFNSEEEFKRLENAILKLVPKQKIKLDLVEVPEGLPKKALSLRKTLLKKSKKIKIKEALGKIAAEIVCPCPPAVPLIMPGEVIESEIIEIFESCRITEIFVLI